MSDTLVRMARKIRTASELNQVVRTMKALTAVNIPIFERAVAALAGYERVIELGLIACFHDRSLSISTDAKPIAHDTVFIVFGSDQGLVGDFNEKLATFCAGKKRCADSVLPVGDRLFDELVKQKLNPRPTLRAPDSVAGIGRVISHVLSNFEVNESTKVQIIHNRPIQNRFYEPTETILLPLDKDWLRRIDNMPWPDRVIPQVFEPAKQTWAALIREYLFVHLFRACAESLASENVARFTAMQRAEKNITDMLDTLRSQYNQHRQNSIDEELFDVVVGAEAVKQQR